MKRAIGIFLLGWLMTAPAFGAAPNVASANYEVEVLVFETRLPDLEGSELWTRAGKPTDPTAITVESMPPSGDFASVMDALRSDSHYHVLLHKHWMQSAESKSTGPAVLLSTDNNEVNGTLKFYLSRFLHVELNVLYQPQSGAIGAAVSTNDGAPAYLISEQRRVKSNDMNYFDHPKFGVLVRISPVAG